MSHHLTVDMTEPLDRSSSEPDGLTAETALPGEAGRDSKASGTGMGDATFVALVSGGEPMHPGSFDMNQAAGPGVCKGDEQYALQTPIGGTPMRPVVRAVLWVVTVVCTLILLFIDRVDWSLRLLLAAGVYVAVTQLGFAFLQRHKRAE
jgi:hypothetical protein